MSFSQFSKLSESASCANELVVSGGVSDANHWSITHNVSLELLDLGILFSRGAIVIVVGHFGRRWRYADARARRWWSWDIEPDAASPSEDDGLLATVKRLTRGWVVAQWKRQDCRKP